MVDVEVNQKTTCSTQTRYIVAALALVLLLTALLRLPAITRPLLGVFATKNVVYAMIARNWAEGRAELWYPTLDVLAGGQRGWHMLEFPVATYLTAWLWHAFGGSLDVWGRSQAVVWSIGSVALMFLFVRRRHGPAAAIAAALALALSPVSIIYGQSFMLEASLVFFTMATFYCLDRHAAAGRIGWLVLAAVCFALLLLTKIYMLVLLLPLSWMILRSAGSGPADDESETPSETPRSGFRVQCFVALLAIAMAIVPAAIWYIHAYRAHSYDDANAERIFYSVRKSANKHLRDESTTASPPRMLLRPDFYRRMLDDLTGVVLTPVGFMLFLAGFLNQQWRRYIPWLLAMVFLVVALPLKFYEMNYYMMAVLPPLCILIGLGWQAIWLRLRPGRIAIAVLLAISLGLSLRYAARSAFITPAEDRGVVAAAEAIRELTAEDEPVATYHGSGIDLLYYCDRPGWAINPDNPKLNQYVGQGARYLIVVGSKESFGLTRVKEGNNFCVYELSLAELK